MKAGIRCYCIFVFVFALLFMQAPHSQAAEQSSSHEYSPVEWSYQGNAVPETYWTPYLPLAQQLIRFKMGFRFSTGTIGVKCPIKLTFSYDPANAQSGKDLPIKIKAETIGASYNTFESAFGLHLPNEIQIGFIGIAGVPDILPWWTLPWDLCELLGKVPGLPDAVTDKIGIACSAIQNVGVNMDTKEALPLPGVKSFHDARTLMEVDLSEAIPDSAKQGLAIKLYNSISSYFGSAGMSELLLMIRLAKNLANEDAARDFLTGLCGSAVDKLTSFAKISVAGDPYFSVEGVELRMNVRMYIPGGKGSGTYPLVFTANNQEKTVTFKDITPFIGSGDKLVVVVDSMTYQFKLKQGLTPQIGISLATINVDSNEKYVSLASAKKDFSEGEYKLEIPLSPSTDINQGLRVNSGCTSMSVVWASPFVPLKGTVKVFDGNTQVKILTESSFKNAHNVIVPGLTQGKNYRFVVDCVNDQGQQIPAGEISGSTRTNDCPMRIENPSDGALTLSGPSAEAGQDWVQLSWTTNRAASTEAFLSPSQDISVNYIASIKKQSGEVITGWATRGGLREFVTEHSMRMTGLDPGTTYYYNLRSWTFQDNDETKQDTGKVGYVGQVATLPPPPPITTIVDALQGNTAMKNVPIEVWKQAGAGPVMTVTTGNDGRTPPVPLDIGIPYVMKIRNQECFKDADSSPITATGDPYQQDIDHVFITAAYKPPPGAYVFDRKGQPISGATATMQTPAGQTLTTTTDANGYFIFTPAYIPPSSTTITIAKQNYVTKQVQAKVEPCVATRKMTIENVTLDSVFATVNISVKDSGNAAINNAAVVVKEGNTQLASLSTNAQGKASFTHNFNDNNANAHNLMITVTPAQASGIKPNTKAVSTIGGSTQDVEIMCLKPAPPPAIPPFGAEQLNLRVESVAGTTALVKWNKYPSAGTFGKYTVFKAANLTAMTGAVVSTIADINTTEYRINNLAGNTQYKYILIIYSPSNQALVGPVAVNFKTTATAPAISNFRILPETVEAGQNVTVSATLTDPDSQVKKAVLKLIKEGTKTEKALVSKDYASNNVQFSCTFSVSAADIGKCAILLEVSDEATTVGQDYTMMVVAPKEETTVKEEIQKQEEPEEQKPEEQKPQVLKPRPQKPQALKPPAEQPPAQQPQEQKPIEQQIQAQNIQEQQPAGELPVLEKTLLKFISKPSSAYVNKEYAIKLGVRSLKGKLLESRFSLDWGDGKKDQCETEISLNHVYQKEGKYTIAATASLKTSGGFIAPGPITSEVTVKVKPPTVLLSRGASKAGVPGYNFVIKVVEGSYPVQSWMFSFGDGKSESGKAEVAKTINHLYPGPGEYKVELSVTDKSNAVTKKSLNLKIMPPPAPKITGGKTSTGIEPNVAGLFC